MYIYSKNKKIDIEGIRPSALIFHEWNKNCLILIFIISNSIQFKWKIIRGMKHSPFLQNSALYLIMIWKKLDTFDKNCTIMLSHIKMKNMQYAYNLTLWSHRFKSKQKT